MIQNELAYINTKHPDFSDARPEVDKIKFFETVLITPPGMSESDDVRQ